MNCRIFSDQIENVLEQIPQKQAQAFRDYFQNAPESVLSAMSLEKRNADRILVEEHEPIEKVFILLSGTVRAIDYRVKGSAYEHARFSGVANLGSMECMFGIATYTTTLVTVTACTFATMPRQVFENWIWQDIGALRAEATRMRGYLLEHTRENRIMLLLSGKERLIYLLVKLCQSKGAAEHYLLSVNRQELAERTGSSVKTVNRSMKALEEEGYIRREGHKVKITQNQYSSMKDYLELISNTD